MFWFLFYRPFVFFVNCLVYIKYPKLIFINAFCFLLDLFHVYHRDYMRGTFPISDLVYGEMSYYSIFVCITKLKEMRFDECIDLGSGLGKVVFFSSILMKCPCRGIEINPIYVDMSKRVLSVFSFDFVNIQKADMKQFKAKGTVLIFFSATCLTESTLNLMTTQFDALHSGSVIISLSEQIDSDHYDMIDQICLPMSWGFSTVFIQQRR